MKKFFALILCLMLALSLCACGGSEEAVASEAPAASEDAQSAEAPAEESAEAPAEESAEAPAEVSGDVLEVPVTIENKTGVDIHQLYASSANLEEWGDDMLGETYLADGESIDSVFYIGANDLQWDLKMADSDGNEIELRGLDFTECSVDGGTIVLEFDGTNGSATLYSK